MSSFFHAEDGIRALTVTGVQTCALPISFAGHAAAAALDFEFEPATRAGQPVASKIRIELRSEERRVGKECRYRWSPSHRKNDGAPLCVTFWMNSMDGTACLPAVSMRGSS